MQTRHFSLFALWCGVYQSESGFLQLQEIENKFFVCTLNLFTFWLFFKQKSRIKYPDSVTICAFVP